MRTNDFNRAVIIVIFLIAFGGGYLLGTYVNKGKVVRPGTPENPAAESSVNLMIDYGNGIVRNWNTVSWKESMSVMDLLETVSGVGAISIEKEIVDGNERVSTIDGIKNDAEDGRRWQYWRNNTYEPRIMSKSYLAPGDLIIVIYAKEQG